MKEPIVSAARSLYARSGLPFLRRFSELCLPSYAVQLETNLLIMSPDRNFRVERRITATRQPHVELVIIDALLS